MVIIYDPGLNFTRTSTVHNGIALIIFFCTRSSEEKPSEPPPPRPKGFRPLYDIPWMFEAREFLRKKLIGKKVNVVVDYIQIAKDNFPEKVCCTVTIGGV